MLLDVSARIRSCLSAWGQTSDIWSSQSDFRRFLPELGRKCVDTVLYCGHWVRVDVVQAGICWIVSDGRRSFGAAVELAWSECKWAWWEVEGS